MEKDLSVDGGDDVEVVAIVNDVVQSQGVSPNNQTGTVRQSCNNRIINAGRSPDDRTRIDVDTPGDRTGTVFVVLIMKVVSLDILLIIK